MCIEKAAKKRGQEFEAGNYLNHEHNNQILPIEPHQSQFTKYEQPTMAPLRNLLPLHRKSETNGPSHEPKNGTTTSQTQPKSRITNKWRNELVACVAEFAGTFMFLFFAFGGTQVANTAALYSDAATAGQTNGGLTQAPNTSVLLYISLVFGFSLMVCVWVFFRVSGGLFNPAVSLWCSCPLEIERLRTLLTMYRSRWDCISLVR